MCWNIRDECWCLIISVNVILLQFNYFIIFDHSWKGWVRIWKISYPVLSVRGNTSCLGYILCLSVVLFFYLLFVLCLTAHPPFLSALLSDVCKSRTWNLRCPFLTLVQVWKLPGRKAVLNKLLYVISYLSVKHFHSSNAI